MSSNITVAVAGVTGKYAKLLLKHLLAKPNVTIHGIARSPNKVDEDIRSNDRVKIFQADSSDTAALRKALQGVSVCICCYLNLTDNQFMIDGQKTLIDACIAEKVPRYIAGDWCFDYRGIKLGDHPTKDPMKVIHKYLEEKEAETKGAIKGVHILNGVFMDVFWTTELNGVYYPDEPAFRCWGTLDETWEGITYADSAKFTAEVAADESATGFLNVLGDKKSIRQIAQEYEQVYGVKPKLESRGTLEDLNKSRLEAYEKDPNDPYKWMMMFYAYWMIQPVSNLGKLDNDRYPGFKAETFKDLMEKYDRNTLAKIGFM